MQSAPPPPPQAGQYRCVVIDPPWPTAAHPPNSLRPNTRTDKPYSLMSMDDIRALPVPEWAAPDCHIWIWTLNGKLASGKPAVVEAIDLLTHWGFKYHTLMTWDKNNMGPAIYGPYRITSEQLVFGWRGNFRIPKEHLGKLVTVIKANPVRGGHSTKPDLLYEQIAEHFPAPRLDVFARQPREGFDVWGDEAPQDSQPSTLWTPSLPVLDDGWIWDYAEWTPVEPHDRLPLQQLPA